MAAAKFRARLTRPRVAGAWTFARIPAPVMHRLGLRARMRVTGTIDGTPFRSSLIPRGDGRLFVVVASGIRDRIGKRPGDSVELALAPDLRPVVIRLPPDFRTALGPSRPAFDRLAPSHRKNFVRWIASAKLPATRRRRIETAVAMIRRGRTMS